MAAPTTTADNNYTDFTKTVTEILTPLTTTDSSSSPAKTEQIITEAVTKLTDLANSLASSPQDTSGSSSPSPSTIETDHPLATLLSDTFSAVFKIVKSTPPQKQTPIIDFLRSLRTHTVSSSSSPSVPLSYENMKIWSDLPTFGWTARDNLNFDPNAASSAQEKQGWENLTSFLAALTAISGREQDGGGEVFDFSLFGLWTLREALEEEKQERGAEEWVKLATVWIQVAGERLKELSLEGGGKEFEGRVAIAGSKYEKEKSGWRGFNPDRWAVWREEFEKAKGWVKDEGIRGEVEKVLGLGVWQ